MRERFDIDDAEYHWSTHDYMPVDKLPYIGRLRRGIDNVYVATGFAKWGLTKGTLAARDHHGRDPRTRRTSGPSSTTRRDSTPATRLRSSRRRTPASGCASSATVCGRATVGKTWTASPPARARSRGSGRSRSPPTATTTANCMCSRRAAPTSAASSAGTLRTARGSARATAPASPPTARSCRGRQPRTSLASRYPSSRSSSTPRGVEAVDPERRTRCRRGRTGGHQADELGAQHFETARSSLGLDARDDLVQRRRLPVLDVHAHLDEARERKVEPERTHARKATAPLAHERRDLARCHNVAAQVDVERDQRATRPDQHATGRVVEKRRPVVRLHLARVDTTLQLLGATAPEERRAVAAAQLAVEEHRQPELCGDPLRRRGARHDARAGSRPGRSGRPVRRPPRRSAGARLRGAAGRSAPSRSRRRRRARPRAASPRRRA